MMPTEKQWNEAQIELARYRRDEQLLVDLFRSPAFAVEGQRGDDRGDSPMRSAARTMVALKEENEWYRQKLCGTDPDRL